VINHQLCQCLAVNQDDFGIYSRDIIFGIRRELGGQTSLPLVIVRPEWICAKMLVGQEDSGFCKSAAAGLRPENGNGTFLP
jgi:hypothetical protein